MRCIEKHRLGSRNITVTTKCCFERPVGHAGIDSPQRRSGRPPANSVNHSAQMRLSHPHDTYMDEACICTHLEEFEVCRPLLRNQHCEAASALPKGNRVRKEAKIGGGLPDFQMSNSRPNVLFFLPRNEDAWRCRKPQIPKDRCVDAQRL